MKSRVTRGLAKGSRMEACDNSGAKMVKITLVKGWKGVRRRYPAAGIGDLVLVSVLSGKPEMRKQVVPAVIVRQRMMYRRSDGTRICFADNAVVILKDDKGNPKGTLIKGPVAKEAVERWSPIGKVASMVV
jgi:large subunit ribosomal protein L14